MKRTIRILLIIFTISFLTSYFSDNKQKIKNLISDNSDNNILIENIKEDSIHQYKENKFMTFINNGINNVTNDIKNDIKKENQQDNKHKIKTEQKKLEEVKILSNNTSKTPSELDKDMRLNYRTLYTSDKVRQDIKNEIYKELGEQNIKSVNRKISASYYVLTQVIDNDKYKELINKKNPIWNSYKENNLYSSIDYLKEAINITQNTSLKNDFIRAYDLCVYGVKNNDVVALIDAKRIIGDIECHILNVSSNKGFFSLNESYKKEPDLYYGASELLEGENYHLIGEYMYNLEDKDKTN